MEGFNKVGQVMHSFYKHLLGSQPVIRHQIDMEVIHQGPVLSQEQQLNLCKEFSEKDIKTAMFYISNIKSPRLNGFSSVFFKSTWAKTGPLICSAVKQFFKIGKLTMKVSATKLIMLPKIPHHILLVTSDLFLVVMPFISALQNYTVRG